MLFGHSKERGPIELETRGAAAWNEADPSLKEKERKKETILAYFCRDSKPKVAT